MTKPWLTTSVKILDFLWEVASSGEEAEGFGDAIERPEFFFGGGGCWAPRDHGPSGDPSQRAENRELFLDDVWFQ